ncbi:MAG: M50 family metallopeptidase [Defluviitaleaceae bacterium]|nr:M50 family metallopeptidase [Defluviitaleaceae bacterium]
MTHFIVNFLVGTYIIQILSVILHELGHYLIAKRYRLKVNHIHLGYDLLKIRIKKLYVSPILIGGYLEINDSELEKLSSVQLIIFFLAGAFANLMIVGIVSFLPYFPWKNMVIGMNIYLMIASIFPIIVFQNDMTLLISWLRRVKINQKA